MFQTTKFGHTYFDDETPGAMRNGTRIIKLLAFDDNEMHPIGTTGTVIGSLPIPVEVRESVRDLIDTTSNFLYTVEWDTMPDIPVVVVSAKIGMIQ